MQEYNIISLNLNCGEVSSLLSLLSEPVVTNEVMTLSVVLSDSGPGCHLDNSVNL